MAYCGVEFMDDNVAGRGSDIAIVNVAWLTPLKREVYWPPKQTTGSFARLVQSNREPCEDEGWKLYNVKRLFFETDDYEIAKKKIKQAEVTSNLESDDPEEPSRRRKKPRRYSISDDSQPGSDHEEVRNTKPKKSLPRPPLLNSSNLSRKLSKSCDTSPSVATARQISKFHSSPVSSHHTYHSQPIESSVENNGAFGRTSTQILENPTASTAEEHNPNYLNVTNKLIALVSHVKEQNDQILAWIGKQNVAVNNNGTSFGIPDIPFSLPVKSEEELHELNDYINNNDNNIALASYLGTLGGATITAKTNRIFKHLLADTVAVKFNYYGQRSHKRPFSDLALKNLILGVVKNSIPNSTDKEIEDVMKVWLKHAQERLKKQDSHARKNQV